MRKRLVSTRVVADAGPLIGLAKINRLDLLLQLFGCVRVPEAVAAELNMDTPLPGATALNHARKQGWLLIQAAPTVAARLLVAVDRGEAEAIALARQEEALLLIDERLGRAAAQADGVRIFGTGALLVKAKQAGLIKAVRPELEALSRCGYRLSDTLQQELLRLAGE